MIVEQEMKVLCFLSGIYGNPLICIYTERYILQRIGAFAKISQRYIIKLEAVLSYNPSLATCETVL